jgi:hypothetical protein
MREHQLNDLNNFIGGWYFDDNSICDKLIFYFNNKKIKGPGNVGSKGKPIVDIKRKDSIDCRLETPILSREYGSLLQEVTNNYVKKYEYSSLVSDWRIVEPIGIQYYKPTAGFHEWHTERSADRPDRHLVFMTYLNDVNDGGETEFYHQKLKVKPEKGLTLIWPSDWTFTHRGVTSKTEEKYIVTGWFSFVRSENRGNNEYILRR